jgi:Mn2+/Fe2+ NRAMP family transporter
MHWRVGLEIKPKRAFKFYATLGAATIAGLALNFVHLDPIKALFIAAVINGILAAPVMVLMMLLTQNRRVMGHFTLPLQLKVLGWAGAGGMCAASVAFLVGAFWS